MSLLFVDLATSIQSSKISNFSLRIASPTRDSPGECHGHRSIIFTGIFIPIQIVSVVLRHLAPRLIKAAWGLEDVVIYVSLAIQMCFAGFAIGKLLSLTDYAGS